MGYVGEPLTWNAAQIRWNYDFGQEPAGGFQWRLKGWLEGSFYPDHNEYDPNPRIDFHERVVSRFGLEGSNEFRQNRFPDLLLFLNFFACFGDSRPQIDYNYRADPIGGGGGGGHGGQLRPGLDGGPKQAIPDQADPRPLDRLRKDEGGPGGLDRPPVQVDLRIPGGKLSGVAGEKAAGRRIRPGRGNVFCPLKTKGAGDHPRRP